MASMIRPIVYCILKNTTQNSRSRQNNIIASVREIHNEITTNGFSLKLQKSVIELETSAWPNSLNLNHVWLRDHCRCNECYNNTTNQRILDLLSIPSDITAVECRIEDNHLIVLWSDGHDSKYSVDWLWQRSYDGYISSLLRKKPILWNGENVSSQVARVEMNEYMKTVHGLKKLVKSVVDFGVGIVENVPATLEATEQVVTHLAPVQHTLFGGMWEFSSEMAHSDTAYTSQALGAHTDNTYFNEAAGLQVFHCLHHKGTGGENLLVDGFMAASNLKVNHPNEYDVLSSTSIESEYLEQGQYYTATGPVLKLHPLTRALEQVRFNLYDRAPMSTLPPDDIPRFYEALRAFGATLRQPAAEWWLKLAPGAVIFIDNWRVLHGRAAYTGRRTMGGCYVNRSDLMSKARVLGLV